MTSEHRRARTSPALRHLDEELGALEARGLLRRPAPLPGARECVVLCSNDYLSYRSLPLLSAPAGSGASRLISGDCVDHRAAESALAAWVGHEEALVFSSGYAANVGTIAALAGPGDLIVSDALNHASLIDGCRLSRADVAVVPHLEVAAVEAALRGARARRRWVVTESYFSMDGDVPDLGALRAICDASDAALVVDEAHALGVIGADGSGACARAGVRADVLIGTLGKALGLQGAFVSGSAQLRLWLWNRARSFVYSTGVSPAIAATVPDRVARARADQAGRARIAAAAGRLRGVFAELGVRAGGEAGLPILPWIVGTPSAAAELSRRLEQQGVLVQAIRPPTVPDGTSRLRVTVTAGLPPADLDLASTAIRRACSADR